MENLAGSGITPYDIRERELQNIPADEREMADQRLFKKITSGKKTITSKDLQQVSREVFRNVINNFKPANKKTAQNPFVGGTFINHYEATHSRNPFGVNIGAQKRLEERFDEEGNVTMFNMNSQGPQMYSKIKKAQRTTGMKKGGSVKKYARGGGIRKAKTYG